MIATRRPEATRPNKSQPTSRRLAGFARRRSHSAPARPHLLAELLAILRRHALPAIASPPMPTRAIAAMSAEPSKKNAAKKQQSKRLPEADRMPSEQSRSKPVPKVHDHFTKAPCEKCNRQRAYHKNPRISLYPTVRHVSSSFRCEFVVNALQPLAEAQHRIALASKQGVDVGAAFSR